MSTLFISHSCHGETDNALAANMRDWLKSQGHESYFLDFDPDKGFGPGIRWEDELYRNLRQCRAVIALLTPDWLTSRWCFAEVTQARAQGKPVFLVEAIRCDGAGMFDDVQHVDLTTDPEDGYRRLAAGLKQVGIDPADAFHWDGSRPPYPGLMAFDREDAAVFFGRDRDIQRGLEKLDSLRRAGKPLFLLLLGASGSGKSSVMRAGLLPRLAKDPRSWLPVTPFRPQDDPLEEMAVKMARALADEDHERDWKTVLRTLTEGDPGDGLRTLARDLQVAANRDDATVLLAVDQFEELFGYTDAAKAGAFLACVRGALAGGGRRLMVVVTMRSDSLAAFQTHPDLEDFDYETLTIDPMPQRDFPRIIEGPAALADITLEPGLVQALVADAGRGEALPLLAFTLRELYERYGDDRLLEIKEYEALGRLEGAVRRAAEGVIDDAKPDEAELTALREAFVPAMVRVDPEGEFMRRRALWLDLPPRAQPLLQRFVEARLLVSRGEGGERVVEVAHEALLRSWPRLEAWLREDRNNLRVLDDMLRDAEVWDNNGRKPGWLNHHGERLAAAEAMARTPRFATRLDDTAKAYLDACIARQKKAARLKRIATFAITALAILSLMGAGVATYMWDEAKDQAETAERERENAEEQARIAQQQRKEAVTQKEIAEKQRGIAERQKQIALSRQLAAEAIVLADRGRGDAIIERGAAFAVESWLRMKNAQATEAANHLVDMLPSLRIEHGGSVRSVAFSPDGRWLATASEDNMARLIETGGGTEVARIEHGGPVYSVALSPDGRRLATGSEDNTARLIETASGTEMARIEHGGAVWSVAFSPDGRLLATASADNTTRLLWADPQRVFDLLCQRAGRNLSRAEWNTYIGADEPWRRTCPNWRNPPDIEPDHGGAKSD